jgi:hypothetical protein
MIIISSQDQPYQVKCNMDFCTLHVHVCVVLCVYFYWENSATRGCDFKLLN